MQMHRINFYTVCFIFFVLVFQDGSQCTTVGC